MCFTLKSQAAIFLFLIFALQTCNASVPHRTVQRYHALQYRLSPRTNVTEFLSTYKSSIRRNWRDILQLCAVQRAVGSVANWTACSLPHIIPAFQCIMFKGLSIIGNFCNGPTIARQLKSLIHGHGIADNIPGIILPACLLPVLLPRFYLMGYKQCRKLILSGPASQSPLSVATYLLEMCPIHNSRGNEFHAEDGRIADDRKCFSAEVLLKTWTLGFTRSILSALSALKVMIIASNSTVPFIPCWEPDLEDTYNMYIRPGRWSVD
eukprot:scpid98931/ scgid19589/ 